MAAQKNQVEAWKLDQKKKIQLQGVDVIGFQRKTWKNKKEQNKGKCS